MIAVLLRACLICASLAFALVVLSCGQLPRGSNATRTVAPSPTATISLAPSPTATALPMQSLIAFTADDVVTITLAMRDGTVVREYNVLDGYYRINTAPLWSPDGKSLAYTKHLPHQAMEFIILPLSSGTPRKLGGAYWEMGLSWSPDSKRIAYNRITGFEAQDGGVIYIVDVETGAVKPITGKGFSIGPPAWSPDGKWIAFSLDKDLLLVSPDGQTRKKIGDDLQFPHWSPDGRRIAALRIRKTDADLVVMQADGSGLTKVATAGEFAALSDFPWSPDGKRILLYDSSLASSNPTLWVVDVDKGERQALPVSGSKQASWSPDGLEIAVSVQGDPKSRIYVLSADGKQNKLIGSGTRPAWSPYMPASAIPTR